MGNLKELIHKISEEHEKISYEERNFSFSNGYGQNRIYKTKVSGFDVKLVVQIDHIASFYNPHQPQKQRPKYWLEIRNPETKKEVEISKGFKGDLVKLKKRFDEKLKNQVDVV